MEYYYPLVVEFFFLDILYVATRTWVLLLLNISSHYIVR